MLLKRFFAVHHAGVADDQVARLHDIAFAADKILPLALHDIEKLQHILMLVQQLGMLLMVFLIDKMQIDKPRQRS